VISALDGCALVEHWRGRVQFLWEGMHEPEAMKGLSVRSCDPGSGQWSIHWMDTRSPKFDTPYVGDFDGRLGEFFRTWQSPAGERIGRIRFRDVSPDSVMWSLAISSDGGGSWTVLWKMGMTRARS